MEDDLYYKNTIMALRETVTNKYGSWVKPHQSILTYPDKAPLPYILWMCDEVEKMDINNLDDAIKASRWIGWILAHAEMHAVWSNEISRNYVRADRNAGFDKPH